MNEKQLTEYVAPLKKVTLNPEIKMRMREELSSFADFHTAQAPVASSSSFVSLFTRSSFGVMKVAFSLALIVGIGSTSFAAQNALPGELLYPVKVTLNENVRSAFALGSDAQAELQASLFVERTDEARTLALQGHGELATSAEVRAGIDAQREKALEAAANASEKTKSKIRREVSRTYLVLKRVLSEPRKTFAQADVSFMATTRSAMPSEAGGLAMGTEMEAAATMSFDAKMQMEESALAMDAQQQTDDFATRMMRVREALAQSTQSPEVKAAIEGDMQKAQDLYEAFLEYDAVSLLTYVESYLGVSSSMDFGGDMPISSDGDDVMQIMPTLPSVMPVDIDHGGMTEPGYGGAGSSGVDVPMSIEPYFEGEASIGVESMLIDVPMEAEARSESSFGF